MCVCVTVCVCVSVCARMCGSGRGAWIRVVNFAVLYMHVCVCVWGGGSGRGSLAVVIKASCTDQAWCAQHNRVHMPFTPAYCAGPFSYPSPSFLLSGSLMQFMTSQSDFY